MKNLKSFPFERNRYFYGKLLSVDDFETEQKYFNDKRRTINRFLFGAGVVCGLHVVEVDDESISLERGIALDFSGREIVVDEPVVKRIVDLEGYDTQQMPEQDSGFYYLCLEYHEENAELVHNVAGSAENNGGEYNKYKEGYHLFVTQTEPEREVFSPVQLYEKRTVVYSGQGVKVSQILPRYLEMGSDTILRIEVENTGQQQNISFEYELLLSFLTYRDGTTVKVCFDEKDYAKAQKYILEIPLKAAYINDVEAEAALSSGSFSLHIGGREYGTTGHCSSKAHVSRQDAGQILKEEYYKSAMDYMVGNTYQQSIYLAKIYVVKAADTCLIQRIERLPFGQHILHTEISTALYYKLDEDIKALKAKWVSGQEQLRSRQERPQKSFSSACGEVIFDLESVRPGEVLYSDRIHHGLGAGAVTIVLGYEVERGLSEDREAIFGDASVFDSFRDGFEASLGAKCEVSEGTFVIGMKIRKNDGVGTVRVQWTALENSVQRAKSQKKQLFIQPDIPNLYCGESVTFTTVCEGFRDERIKWSVKDLGGGTIDKNGKYTAPETAGVFQISASSVACPDVGASTFVVVREKEK